jgi:HK97 gp10 family phage protein
MSVEGLAKLNRKLQRLPVEVRGALVKANSESADAMVALAKRLVPRKTGALERSIRKTTPLEGVVTIRAGGPLTTTEVRKGSGVAYDYASAVEFGTAPHKLGGLFAGGRHPGTKAQPFFYPAYRALKKTARSKAARAIKKAALEVAGS